MELTQKDIEPITTASEILPTIPTEQLSPSPIIIIEEISRGQKMLRRHKLSQDSITIGRGYDNDIILSDPHICPNHIHLDFAQGSWILTDKNTVNGSFIEHPKNTKQKADQHKLNDGDIINVGKSQLRILFIDHPVAPTVNFSPFESFIDLMRHPLALFINIALFIGIAGSLGYLSSPIESNYSQFFVNAIGMALIFGLWPAGVALVSHLTKHDARTMAQFGISFVFFNMMWFSDFVDTLVAFNTANKSLMIFIAALLPIGLTFCMFWLNAYIGFHMTAKRRIIVALSITTLLFGGSYLVQFSHKPEFDPRPQYNATIMAPAFLLKPSSTVNDFIDDSNHLFEKAKNKAKSSE